MIIDHTNPDYVKKRNSLTNGNKYKKIYASGRTALQAKVLGCEVLPHETNFPDSRFWKVLDNKDVARLLQRKLNEIDDIT